ncbi:MAG: UDP-3-O-(3-hydroxymyristoyl)glucosamine N-acyltransferase, partial [Gemmatimonadetes bacterium]|nr:UDP-3-O-(3-hydroxymyristoyl)glucosamine N-acyltransferase [Gemmatimonadota bacterium]
MPMPLHILAERIGAQVVGDDRTEVIGCAPIDQARPDEVTFLANAKYHRYLATTKAAAVIVDARVECPPGLTRLVAADPYFAFRNAMIALHGFREHPRPMDENRAGLSAHASVHPRAAIGAGAIVHPHAVVERGAVVGERCVLYPGSYVGEDARLGADCTLYPNAVVYDRCVLGDRVTL